MIKKALLTVATLFLIWQSCILLLNIGGIKLNSWAMTIFVAWILNLFITGIFAFSGFAFSTYKLLPKSYYSIHNPEKLKAIYKLLRVGFFKQLLLATFWKNKKQRKRYFNGSKSGINNLAVQSMTSEFGHVIPFIILCFLSIYFVLAINITLGIFTILINIVGNLYPVILQRHHRMRIARIAKRG